MKRVVLSIFAGLTAWGVLIFLVILFQDSLKFRWFMDGAPVFLAGGLAGYVARRHGLICGGIIGAVQLLSIFSILLLMGLANMPFREVMNLIKSTGLVRTGLTEGVMTLLTGALGGYLGQLLEQTLRLRKKCQAPSKISRTP